MQMTPGAPASPPTSITVVASPAIVPPSAAILPSWTARSPTRPGAPLPSNSRPPRRRTSNFISRARSRHANPARAAGLAVRQPRERTGSIDQVGQPRRELAALDALAAVDPGHCDRGRVAEFLALFAVHA